MRKAFLLLAITSTIFLSFTSVNSNINLLTFCDNLNAVINEEPNEFIALKGELEGKNDDGSKDYVSKIKFSGWDKTNYGIGADGAISIDVTSKLTTKAEAQKLFDATSKQLGDCLGVKPINPESEHIEQLEIFTKSKVDVGLLLLLAPSGKYFVMLSISRES